MNVVGTRPSWLSADYYVDSVEAFGPDDEQSQYLDHCTLVLDWERPELVLTLYYFRRLLHYLASGRESHHPPFRLLECRGM